MKKKLLAVLAVIALILPTFLAIGSYFWTEKSPTETGKITEITILDLNGKSYKLAAADDSDKLIDSLISLESVATPLTALPDPLISADYFMITYASKTNKDADYKYYFSLDDDLYFVNADGVAYKADAKYASDFLSSKYAACLYDSATAPALNVYDKTVAPESMTWKYKTADGKYTALEGIALSSDKINVALGGALDFTFDIVPDSLQIVIKNGNEVLFNDTYEKLSNFSFDASAKLSVSLDAKWFEDDKRDYHGEAKYSFDLSVTESAAFYLVQNEIAPGDFVVLTGKNVSDITKISFSSTPSIDYTPVFFEDGDYVRALIPIKVELDNKSYVFTVKYGNTFSQDINLTIREQTFASRTWTNTKANLEQTRSEAILAAYNSTMAPVAATQVSEKLWNDGDFVSVGKGSTAIAGFGQHVTLSATGEKFRHDGAFYVMAAGESVTAINRGKVIYAGVTDYAGRCVVVDHGWGLKSWYSNMDSISVAVGDIVEAGAPVGVIGGSGFIKDGAARAVHLKLTVFDVPVFPYDSLTFGALNIKMYN